jgi:Na+/serine symporter
MNVKLLGVAVLAIGIVVLVLSVFADTIGVGANEEYTYGWKQALGTVLGVALIVIGGLVWRAASRSPFTSS